MIIDFEDLKYKTKKGARIKRLEDNVREANEAFEEALNPTDLRVRNGIIEGPDIIEVMNRKARAEYELLLERRDGKPEDLDEELEIMRKLKSGELTEKEVVDAEFGEGSYDYFNKVMEEGWELDDDDDDD